MALRDFQETSVSFVCEQPPCWCSQCHTTHNEAHLLAVEDNLLLAFGPGLGGTYFLVHLDFVVRRHAVFVLFLHWWDIDGRVTVLKQWDIHFFSRQLNHRHLSLHHHMKVRSVLFEILLGCGKGLPVVEGHRGYPQLLS